MRSPVHPQGILLAFVFLLLAAAIISAGCENFLNGTGSSLRANTTGELRACILDVGQGDSSVVLFGDRVILIDAGETDQGGRVVSDLVKLGVKKIDLLVATHPHSDHIGGMQAVLAHFPVAKVLDTGSASTSPLYGQFLHTVDQKEIPYVVARRGMSIDIDPSLRVFVLSPPEEWDGDDANAGSIVLRISYGTVSLLFTGDATTAAEDDLGKTGYPLGAQVLKVGHHGSSGSSSAAFLSRVDPEVAIISLGSDNEYGHPHRETLDRLKAAGPVVLRTDIDGTVLVRSNGETFSVVTEKESGDIWSLAAAAFPGQTTAPATASPQTAVTANATTFPVPAIPANVTIPVPLPTIPALQIGNASDIRISAVQFDAPGDDTKNLNGEWVRIANRGEGSVLLTSWMLSDRTGTGPYRFPAFLLLPGSSVTVYTGSGVLNDTSLFMGRTEPLWGNGGDEAVLRDGSGNIIDRNNGEGSP